MYIWTVTANWKNKELAPFNPAEVSEPYISAEYAMKDWFHNELEWRHVAITKFSGTVLEHWQAEDNEYDYVLEKQHVNGSEDD